MRRGALCEGEVATSAARSLGAGVRHGARVPCPADCLGGGKAAGGGSRLRRPGEVSGARGGVGAADAGSAARRLGGVRLVGTRGFAGALPEPGEELGSGARRGRGSLRAEWGSGRTRSVVAVVTACAGEGRSGAGPSRGFSSRDSLRAHAGLVALRPAAHRAGFAERVLGRGRIRAAACIGGWGLGLGHEGPLSRLRSRSRSRCGVSAGSGEREDPGAIPPSGRAAATPWRGPSEATRGMAVLRRSA